jgi:hypothetical protein
MSDLSKHIPKIGRDLVKYKGSELVDKLGLEAIIEIVSSVLTGGNVRNMTERLTQRRIALSNISLLVTYINAVKAGISPDKIFDYVENELIEKGKVTAVDKVFLKWMIGLTGKSIQNVLRGDKGKYNSYVSELKESLESIKSTVSDEFGELSGSISLDGEELPIDWDTFLQLSLAIGTQALAIRGAEKSMYGKFFEKLILGSVLTILGFKFVVNNKSEMSMVFWLSERGDKRESDASLLIEEGKGVRFDIGFIGVGNTEISLDKVSRFEREIEIGGKKHKLKTIILIDRIGEGSRITEMAKQIDGLIIQMSNPNWVHEVASALKDTYGYHHEILDIKGSDLPQYINDKMHNVDLSQFINYVLKATEEETDVLMAAEAEIPYGRAARKASE